MQKRGDNDQHGQIPTSQVISEPHGASSHFHEAPYTSVFNSNDATNIAEIVNVLSQVELPSPSPVQATCCTSTTEDNLITFHEGQSSGGKKDDETAVNAEQRETELKDKHNNLQEPRETQSLAHRKQYTERRRRSQIQEKIRVLKELVPDCNKRDQASILDDTIAYIKSLQMQLQMMQCMGAGAMPQSPYFTMRPMYEMGYVSIGHYGSYFTSNFPIFQPFTSRIGPSVPSIENFVGSPRLLQIPHQEFPSQTTERACSSTFSSDTILPATGDQVGSGISSQCSHRMQVTNQETHQASSARVREIPPKS